MVNCYKNITSISHKVVINLLLGAMFILSGCWGGDLPSTLKEWGSPRHITPVPMRRQIFNNSPTGQLQNKSIYQERDLIPELRNQKEALLARYKDPGPYGDDSYGAGFEAGCDNMVSVIGAGSMRLIKPKFDTDRLTTDQWYLRGYEDAASWCTFNLDWETH